MEPFSRRQAKGISVLASVHCVCCVLCLNCQKRAVVSGKVKMYLSKLVGVDQRAGLQTLQPDIQTLFVLKFHMKLYRH